MSSDTVTIVLPRETLRTFLEMASVASAIAEHVRHNLDGADCQRIYNAIPDDERAMGTRIMAALVDMVNDTRTTLRGVDEILESE